jgi:2Fe-2S ferredoxin
MPLVTVLPHAELCPDGQQFEVRKGASLCEAFLKHGIAIEHACDMVAACATCHVLIRAGADSLDEPDDDENDQLDNAWGLEPCSRLACCVRLKDGDITVAMPMHSRNHARER